MARPSLAKLFRAARRLDRDAPDVVVIVRLRLNEEGGWDTRWEGAHWLNFEQGAEPPPGALPPGVAEQLVKVFSYNAAQRVGGRAFASLDASFGKAAVDQISSLFAARPEGTTEDENQ